MHHHLKNRVWYKDATFWFLIVTNIIIIIVATRRDFNFLGVLWMYWIQTTIILSYSLARIATAKKFSVEGYQAPSRWAKLGKKSAYGTMGYYLVWFVFFGIVLIVKTINAISTHKASVSFLLSLIFSAVLFFGTYTFAYFRYVKAETGIPNIYNIAYGAGVRLFPMIIGMFFLMRGSDSLEALAIFLIIKFIIDISSQYLYPTYPAKEPS